MLQLDRVTASKVKIETALKAAKNDLSVSNNDRNQLSKLLSITKTLNNGLLQKLDEAKEKRGQNAEQVDETNKRLKAVQKCVAELTRDRDAQMQANNKLQDELDRQNTDHELRSLKAEEELERLKKQVDVADDNLR